MHSCLRLGLTKPQSALRHQALPELTETAAIVLRDRRNLLRLLLWLLLPGA